ncbi:E3 ubiquitin-protein ligase TRIM39-like [Protopterus annectens]|uniref:E3 ubiquitin-protein ligase TRIM39-like n=1 Tax=Protopterus annectens TaxID=7888 RepID=UPI001CF93C79|nr:E3 ubiquitin-protein ligase TRIM39-like [Protopterus annectens]
MATGRVADYLDEDLVCPVCSNLFEDPVILECGHHFCRSCIDKVWDREQILSCPECRAEWPAKKYTINRVLAKMVEKAQVKQEETKGGKPQQEQKSHCALGSQQCLEHREGLKLFCKEDESPICVVCMVSQKHAGHTFLPVLEAVSMFQEKLKTATDALEFKLKCTTELQLKQEGKISYIQNSCCFLIQLLDQLLLLFMKKLTKYVSSMSSPFTDAENDIILEALCQHHQFLQSRGRANTEEWAALWADLISDVNSIDHHNRTFEQVQHCATDIINATYRRTVDMARDHDVTGGGPAAEQPLSATEEFLAILVTQDISQASITKCVINASISMQEEHPDMANWIITGIM